MLLHKDILEESDELLIMKLALLLQLAVALDRSEIQAVSDISAQITDKQLYLKLTSSHAPFLELREIAELSKDFLKVWNLKLVPEFEDSSTR
jgi:exopolyphosphatase/guanosine-5'-triphosphate,3'-diphosphate pyrophosphatase